MTGLQSTNNSVNCLDETKHELIILIYFITREKKKSITKYYNIRN